MEEQLKAFERLSEGAAALDGSSIRVTFGLRDEPPLKLAIAREDIEKIVQYLVYLAIDAAVNRGAPTKFAPEERIETFQIPATSVALMPGSARKAILALRLHGFDLGFELPIEELQQSLPSFVRTVEMLATEPKSTN